MSYNDIEFQREAQRSSEYDEFSYYKKCKKKPLPKHYIFFFTHKCHTKAVRGCTLRMLRTLLDTRIVVFMVTSASAGKT